MIHEYYIPFKGIGKKTVYHFNDSHLSEYDSLSDEKEKEEAIKGTNDWSWMRADYTRWYGEPYEDFQQLPARKHFEMMLSEAENGDSLVMAGDILDYVSMPNIRYTDAALSGFGKPYMAVCGNHEIADEIPAGSALSGMKDPIQVLDLGDMQIIGIDNSTRTVTKDQLEALRTILESGRPSLLAMHVPVKCEQNAERLNGSGSGFQFNYDGCPEENLEMLRMLEEYEDNIIALLAGHLHYADNSFITPKIRQYVCSQALVGNINKFYIGENI
ncbi:MAG: metallophosphoesterase [Clostridia bacterium]|nr:metallophosphoesterase [Clostridia bacterium]